MNSLAQIEASTKKFADDRDALKAAIRKLNDDIDAAKRAAMPVIKRAVAKIAERHSELTALIDDSRDLFVKPRTVIFHGIKVGITKGKGSIDWDDDNRTVSLIEKHLPDQADVLIKTTKKPLKKALAQLSTAELKKIGCTVEETGDIIVIKPTDSEVDKMVTALIADATAIEESEATSKAA